ncbi:hypothetical protein [Paenibacillus eucommiae]|uniref:Linalool dehydratase/isomerase domain-containing protein n=1 Tax=Paenibacillus eucommiae TaxID=1355755 RepID=A0ABS4IMZ3_9BACL|nr:hypothetical protein [Paenibacillus eucommiae]MBP1988880.1 hypothetical protein [Paenibacillus eucommiae]
MKTVSSSEKWLPPHWALWQRKIFDILNQVSDEFVDTYTRPDGTLIWRDEWPGMDGSDDPYEGFMNFPLLYALGGKEELNQVSRKLWDAFTWQWTEYGQIHREFDAYYDWMHHGEASLYIYFFGLADPTILKDRQRAIRFADMYTGDDPESLNYDKEKKLIRSPINGSRGPRFLQTAEDWSTHREVLDNYPPPFEDIPGVPGPKCQWTDDGIYTEVLERINSRMAKGDVPLNLTSTSLITNAYMYTGDQKYLNWVLEYLNAWKERTEQNGGITPDNIGLSGEIGEHMDGKWWGGYYGWRWPHGAFTIIEPLTIAGCNAVLMNQQMHHLDLVRSQLDMLWELRQEQDGQSVIPHKHLDSGWSDYRPMNPWYPLYCWTISMDDRDLERMERIRSGEAWSEATANVSKGFIGNHGPWYEYIRGNNADYPEQILRANYEVILSQLEKIRSEQGDPSTWDVHHWQLMTPMIVEGLVQTTLGAPMHIYHGGLLHTRVRYFDGQLKRPGLPEQVAALVEKLESDSTTLTLINLDLSAEKQVIIQAGGFGEHSFTQAVIMNQKQEVLQVVDVNSKWLQVELAPGAGVQLKLGTSRYVNQPTYDTPWNEQASYALTLQGRNP